MRPAPVSHTAALDEGSGLNGAALGGFTAHLGGDALKQRHCAVDVEAAGGLDRKSRWTSWVVGRGCMAAGGEGINKRETVPARVIKAWQRWWCSDASR